MRAICSVAHFLSPLPSSSSKLHTGYTVSKHWCLREQVSDTYLNLTRENSVTERSNSLFLRDHQLARPLDLYNKIH